MKPLKENKQIELTRTYTTTDFFFSGIFPHLRDRTTYYPGWTSCLKAIYGEGDQMDEEEKRIYCECTHRTDLPTKEFSEVWLDVSRRAGKSSMGTAIMAYEAIRQSHEYAISGENPRGTMIASDRQQAGVDLSYLRGYFEDSEYLRPYLKEAFKESLVLHNDVILEVQSCSYRSVRGRTCFLFLAEELAFWHIQGERPADQIIAAMRPSLATAGGKMIVISSPYSRQGPLYEHYERYYGKNDPNILYWKAATRTMNPTISEKFINNELSKDRAAGASEWLGEWRSDISGAYDHDAVMACATLPGEMGPKPYQVYSAFVDPSGGNERRHDCLYRAL